ncbi:hypothetical protein LTR62_001769 [Meristemomyces frigidus]|uniref:C2H2-type domain-containing protein n=1 Tax=Meristemomyces frigidus TaxID=1508187 RepID=A0AAN7TMU7_9PEZI|nr:hypothetical protein LTR62_001769 [Meristemomyces frigidus]
MVYAHSDGFASYPQQFSMLHSRSYPRYQHASQFSMDPYNNMATSDTYPLQHTQSRYVEGAASPTTEDSSRPLLPSISNLLGIADGPRGDTDTGMTTLNAPKHDQGSCHPESQLTPQTSQPRQVSRQHSQRTLIEQRHSQSYASHDAFAGQRIAIPPTPPFRNDSVIEHSHSPSTISTGSSLSAPSYSAPSYHTTSAFNNVEADQQGATHTTMPKRASIPSQPHQSPYRSSPYNASPYAPSPAVSNGSYYSPMDPHYPPPSALYNQCPLPSNFPPPPPANPPQLHSTTSTPNLTTTTASNPWEHHHYIAPSSHSSFPGQSQDRYICPTCTKAFSRPSSLKIHSHSHTGEKPFKCPRSGCGKAFSVRSNMKRHERGCHTGGVGAMGVNGTGG